MIVSDDVQHTKTRDGLDLDLFVFMSGEVQQKLQHFFLDDNLRDTGESVIKPGSVIVLYT